VAKPKLGKIEDNGQHADAGKQSAVRRHDEFLSALRGQKCASSRAVASLIQAHHADQEATMNFQGTRIVVLGGSSGIGLAVAQAAARAGATVVIASSRRARVDEALKTRP
jgi:5,10-methylene-tetrahydrofolate dehydrogenase/methenyl tetrahydrofolate cyclohydrolase